MRSRPALRLATPSVALAAALLLRGPEAAAEPPLLGLAAGEVHIEAERLEVDVYAGNALLTGAVALKKGDVSVKCPRLEVKFDTTPHVTWAKGAGGVAADVRGVHAEAPEVEVDLVRQSLELRGGVRLSRGQGFIQADKATIDLATAKVTATQVRGTIPVPKP